MSARELITEHLDLWTGAVAQKATRGRGSNGRVELTGVKKLRELILGMAVQGTLTTREASDKPASDLLQRILERQTQLYTQGKIKKRKKLPSVSVKEQYFHLPENWEWTRLGTLFDAIMSGGTPSKQNPRFWDGDIPWASVKDLGKAKHLGETQDYITEEGLKAGSKLADTGDVLICTRMGLGKVAICSRPIAINQDLKAVKVSPEVSLDYFFLAYTTLDITGTGTTVAGITQDKLLNYVIGLPPIEEQHRIVQKVDELMALCDRLEQQTSDQLEAHGTLVDTLLGTLTQSENATELADNWARLAAHFDTLFTTEQSIDKLKQAILQLAVMGRLTHQDPSEEPASILLEKIANEMYQLTANKRTKKAGTLPPISDEELPFEKPLGWEAARLHSLIAISSGDGLTAAKMNNDGGIPVFGGNGVNGFHSEANVKEPTLVIGRVGYYCGSIHITPEEAWVTDNAFITRYAREHLSQRYLYWLLKATNLKEQDNATAQPVISGRKIYPIVMIIAPRLEQDRIAGKIDELMALCDQLKERLNQASETRNHLAEAVVKTSLN